LSARLLNARGVNDILIAAAEVIASRKPLKKHSPKEVANSRQDMCAPASAAGAPG